MSHRLPGLTVGLAAGLGAALLATAGGCSSGDDSPGHDDAAPAGPAYAFLNLQADGETPVSWRSCRPIPVDADLTGAPPGSLQLYRTALVHTAEATGFTFHDYTRAAPIPGVRPVTVRWGSAREVQGYGADLAAFTSTTVAEDGPDGGLRHYVSGQVVLDVDAFTRLARRGDTATAQGLLDHELGHLVGLDHVADEDQLMHAEYVGQRGWGDGDRAGLAVLGRAVPCQSGSSATSS